MMLLAFFLIEKNNMYLFESCGKLGVACLIRKTQFFFLFGCFCTMFQGRSSDLLSFPFWIYRCSSEELKGAAAPPRHAI